MEYPQECVCGRSFSQVNAMSHHRRTCKKSKTRLSSALTTAHENWSRKKARRNEDKRVMPLSAPDTLVVSPKLVNALSTVMNRVLTDV